MRTALPLALLVLAPPAFAGRPDEGVGLHHFDDTDTIEFLDGPAGVVRVFYSIDGPNATWLDDDDASGRPDFPEEVAATAEDVLGTFADTGFRAPLAEGDVGLGDLGGSQALDFYLVDFALSADGSFVVDGCNGNACAGHMVMENDFRGYGYPSLSSAIRVLTSHELFHAVQAAYRSELDVWLSEGTAAWAEKLYDDDSSDFRAFADRYLEDTGRPIDRPPAEPVPAFAYATCLFWEFLSLRLGDDAIVALLESTEELEGLDAVEDAITTMGSTIEDEWVPFTAANLMTGPRAGPDAFYPFATDIDGLVAAGRAEGFLTDEERFYPLAATYWLFSHDGGALWFASSEDPSGLVFALHPVDGRGESSPTRDATATWEPAETRPVSLGDLPAGDYWLRGTFPTRAPQSVRVAFCLGTEDDVGLCTPGEDAGPGDGGPSDGGDDASPDATPSRERHDDGGCGCHAAATPQAASAALLSLAALALRRRRSRDLVNPDRRDP